jgi:hypothetical protein
MNHSFFHYHVQSIRLSYGFPICYIIIIITIKKKKIAELGSVLEFYIQLYLFGRKEGYSRKFKNLKQIEYL